MRLALIVVLLLGVLAAPASALDRVGECQPSGAKVIDRSGRSSVVTWHELTDRNMLGITYACSSVYHRQIELGVDIVPRSSTPGTAVGPVDVNRRFVAFSVVDLAPSDHAYWTVKVRSLRTGAWLWEGEAEDSPPADRGYGKNPQDFGLTDVAVSDTGTPAWIVWHADRGRFEVYTVAGGTRILLDAGLDIAPMSLAIRGATVAWSKGRVRHRAPLR